MIKAQHPELWKAPEVDESTFDILEDGVYDGICVGIVARNFPDYDDKTKEVLKVVFVYQICGSGGVNFYLRSRPMTISRNAKSVMASFITTWTGVSFEYFHDNFDLEKMLGVKAQVVVNSITKENRTYNNIANVLKGRKNVKAAVIPDAIPGFIVRNAVDFQFCDGITIKEEPKQMTAAQPAAFPQGLPGGVNSNAIPDNINDNLPGFVSQQAQVPAQKRGKAPAMPANAQVTQNADPAGFMGAQGFTVTQVAPQPAQPEIQTAQQAMVQEGLVSEEDDDSDLPF